MANRITTFADGNALTAAQLNGEYDNIVGTGTIDKTGGRWGMNDDVPATFGSSQDCSLAWNTTQSQNALVLGLGASRTMIVCDEADKGTNFAIAAQSSPCLVIHSASTTAAKYLALYHDDNYGTIDTGAGALYFRTAGSVACSLTKSANAEYLSIPSADLGDGYQGAGVSIGCNTNATNPGAGYIALYAKDSTAYYLWVDATGDLRIHTSPPTTANDTAGGIIGSVFPVGTKIFLGDTADANITTGLCINQGAADDAVLTLKSSDVDHGMTTLAETDTYCLIQKYSAAEGGLSLQAYGEGTTAVHVHGAHGVDNTTKSTAGVGALIFTGSLKSGAGSQALGADANIAVFRNYTATRFILDGDGDSHQDVGTAWTNFDEYDDARLLEALSRAVSRPGDALRENFVDLLKYNREALEKARLVTFNEDGHHFVNMSRLSMLLTGAVRQLTERLERMEQKLIPQQVQGGQS